MPSVIASGETTTIPAGRVVVHPNLQVDGVLNVEGSLFIPAGGSVSDTAVDTDVLTVSTAATLPSATTIGSVSAVELGYLDGVTSNIQTQISTLTTSVDALKDVAQNTQSVSYTLALSDRGKSIDTSAGVTVPLNSAVAFPVGSVITITNTSSAAITITQTAGVTLRNAGTTTTGNRTLANYGMATLRKIATDTWFISGAGVS